MKRRAFLTGTVAGLAAARLAEAQRPGADATQRVPRVGYLGSGHPSDRSSPRFMHLFEAFAQGLREAGYVDRQNVMMIWKFAEQRYERLPELAAELVRADVAVIFATTDHAATAARQATETVPIVFNQADDPVASRFAVSLSRPGGNMTGFTQAGPQLTAKRLGFLKEAVPRLSRVAVLRNPMGTVHVRHVSAAETAARALGLKHQVFDSRGPDDFEPDDWHACGTGACGIADGIRRSLERKVAPRGRAGGQDSERRPAGRDSDRGAIDLRACPELEDRQGPRPHHAAVTAATGKPRNRMMQRRAFVAGMAVVMAPVTVQAQQAGKVHTIGVLWMLSPPDVAVSPNARALRDGLREFGYVEGRNLVVVQRYAESKPERLPALAAELAGLPLDVLVAATSAPSIAAKRATTTIPVVAVYTPDPVGEGLAASLSRPGGNVTGLSSLSIEYVAKMLEFLGAVRPGQQRIAVLGDPAASNYAIYWRQLNVASSRLRMSLEPVYLRSSEDLEKTFSVIRGASQLTGLLVMHQTLTFHHRERIADLALKKRLPAVYGSLEYAEAGGLLAYGTSAALVYRRAAVYVDKILRGAKPSELPIEQPTKFELVINLKTARALGLTIPPSLLLRADQVIE
jgi:ABC-type uncharacterized transport system substrate-binding protein